MHIYLNHILKTDHHATFQARPPNLYPAATMTLMSIRSIEVVTKWVDLQWHDAYTEYHESRPVTSRLSDPAFFLKECVTRLSLTISGYACFYSRVGWGRFKATASRTASQEESIHLKFLLIATFYLTEHTANKTHTNNITMTTV
jgi:hypothetical protein